MKFYIFSEIRIFSCDLNNQASRFSILTRRIFGYLSGVFMHPSNFLDLLSSSSLILSRSRPSLRFHSHSVTVSNSSLLFHDALAFFLYLFYSVILPLFFLIFTSIILSYFFISSPLCFSYLCLLYSFLSRFGSSSLLIPLFCIFFIPEF